MDPCAVVVTALPHEAHAVTEHLIGCHEVHHPKGTTYIVGQFRGSAAVWKVAVVQTGPGNASAAQATERAINYFYPEITFFTGVAGGRKDAQVGDIIVADKVYGYESGKDTDEGLMSRPELFVPSYRLLQRAQMKSLQDAWLSRVGTSSPGNSPRIFVKPIASGEKLIVSSKADIADLLTRNYGDAVAVEMEGYGFLKAVHANPGVEALVIRGISDLLDNKGRVTDSEDQVRAARHAATFALELLASVEPAPRARGGRPPSEDSAQVAARTQSVRLGAMELAAQSDASGDDESGRRLDSFLLRMQSRRARPENSPPPACKARLLLHFPPSEANHPRLNVSLHRIPPEGAPRDDKQEPLLSLSLEFAKSDDLFSVLESIVCGAEALTNAQATKAVGVLVEASARKESSSPVRNELLREAAELNLAHRTELAHALGVTALELTELKPDCVNSVMRALHAESIALGVSRAHAAADRLGALVIMLASKAVSLGAAGAEALYSAAKRIRAPQQALNVYQDILKLHPAYEARWYWQRDVGDLLYGMNRHLDAAAHYDRAVALKPENSKLHRYAGDAYYYAGEWSEAAQRFQRAVSIEPMEKYFVETKLTYCRAQLSAHVSRSPSLERRRKLASGLTDIGVWMEDRSIPLLPGLLFKLSLAIATLTREAAVRLALAANRRGRYARALHWLLVSLMSLPEDPGTWLNAAVNVLFLQGNQWSELSRAYAKAALFHGGPEAVERLRVRLVNTRNGDELLAEFENNMLKEVRAERDNWLKRRIKILAPENYGGVFHYEFDEP